METAKRLGTMNIYKHRGTSCANGGISDSFDEVIIVSEFDEDAPSNAVVVITENKDSSKTIPRAEPANGKGRWAMFGGSFIYTSNALVPNSGKSISLFDRFEERYNG